MPQRAWRTTRDLSAALALFAVVQLAVSLAIVRSLSTGFLVAELALVAVLAGIALMAHLRLREIRDRQN